MEQIVEVVKREELLRSRSFRGSVRMLKVSASLVGMGEAMEEFVIHGGLMSLIEIKTLSKSVSEHKIRQEDVAMNEIGE
jgi:hypothetical protein